MAQTMLSKTSTLELAKNLAKNNPDLTSKTAHELEAMSYEDRNRWIGIECNKAWSILMMAEDPAVDPKHRVAFSETYNTTVHSAWGNKLSGLQNQRSSFFRTLNRGIDPEAANTMICALVESFHLRGMSPISDPTFGISVRVNRGAEEASLNFRMDRDSSGELVNPDNEQQRVGPYTLRAEISWSSTQRSIERALVAAAMYRELAEVAAEVIATMEQRLIMWKRGF